MATHLPYSQTVYLESGALMPQVVEAQSPTSEINLQTDCISTKKEQVQRWYLDPWSLDKNQIFVKLESQHQLVLESRRVDGEKCFLNVQGDFHVNGGIQT